MAALELSYRTPGLEYVVRCMAKMPEFITSKSIKKAWIEGGRYMIKKGKDNLRRENRVVTGNLMKSFKYTIHKSGSGMSVGFRRSSGAKQINGGNHAHLVDLGHKLVVGSKRVDTGKKTKASLFWTDVRQQDTRPAGKIIGDKMLEIYAEYVEAMAKQQPSTGKYY